MSTIYLHKKHGEDNAGSVVSRPFLVARALIAAGAADYPDRDDKGVPIERAPTKAANAASTLVSAAAEPAKQPQPAAAHKDQPKTK